MTENERLNEDLEDFEALCNGKTLCITGEALNMVISAVKKSQVYESIGTIEEFKALKEKIVAKKPIYGDFDENEAEEIIPHKAVCPVCGHEFEFGTWNDEENHHCVCGQKLDWSE